MCVCAYGDIEGTLARYIPSANRILAIPTALLELRICSLEGREEGATVAGLDDRMSLAAVVIARNPPVTVGER